MIPKVNDRGHSFKGIAAYLMNPTEDMLPDQERVSWSETGNMLTDDIEKAAKVMAWTAMHADELKVAAGGSLAGAKPTAGDVYHYSLAWALKELPEQDHMREQALETLSRLGLSEHEYFIVAHADRDHSHLHVVANLVNPENGKRAELGGDYVTLQKWALEYEREYGLHCQVREENAAMRGQGKGVKYRDQKQDYSTEVTRAFHLSDNGQSFVNALEMEGLQIAPARRGKGFLIIDQNGDIQKLGRQIDLDVKGKEKTAQINAKLADIDRERLGDADQISQTIKENLRASDRELADVDRQNEMLDGAEEAAKQAELAEKLEAQAKAKAKEEERQKAFTARYEKMELRQAEEQAELETRLSEAVGADLKAIQADAERYRGYAEDKGFKLSLRRLWRGKKDREILEDLKGQVDQMQTSMETARQKLAKVHENEKAELEKLRDKKWLSFKERTPEQQQKFILSKAPQPEFSVEKYKPVDQYTRGFGSSHEHDQQKRLMALHGKIGHDQKMKTEAAQTQRKKLADQARYETRRAELDKQKSLEAQEREARQKFVDQQLAKQQQERQQQEQQRQAEQWKAQENQRREQEQKSLADREAEARRQFVERQQEIARQNRENEQIAQKQQEQVKTNQQVSQQPQQTKSNDRDIER